MKHLFVNSTMRWALLMLFAFATPMASQAQFGNLMRRAKEKAEDAVRNKKNNNQNETSTKSDEQQPDIDPYGAGQLDQIRRNREQASQTASKSSDENPIYEGKSDKVVATWNAKTNTFTLVRTFTEGDLAGQPVTYTLDTESGELRRNDGQLMGKIVGSDVEIPNVGTVTVDHQRGGGLNMDGQGIGKATRTEAFVYGRQLARFRREASSREIVALFCLVEYATPEAMAEWKGAMDARHEREAQAQGAFKANMKKITAGNFQTVTGTVIGKIAANGDVFNKGGQRIGHVASDGTITGMNGRLGSFNDNGMVYDKTGSPIGHIQPNGNVDNVSGTRIGQYYNDGGLGDSTGSRIAKFTGAGVNVAAVCYYFFFPMK